MLLNSSLETLTFLKKMRNSAKLPVTAHGKPYWFGILGWCIWEGELCVFHEQNLKHLTYKYFDTFLFAHL